MTTIEVRKTRAAEQRTSSNRYNQKYVHCHDAFIGLAVDKADDEATLKLFIDACNFLYRRGFKISADPDIIKRHPCLSKHHRYGRKGNLECNLEWYPAGLKIEFYQNVNFENPHGGYYDFNKIQRMQFLVRMLFQHTKSALLEHFGALGYPDKTEITHTLAIDQIFHRIKTSCHWDGGDLLEWRPRDDYNRTDANGKMLEPGQTKFFYHWEHRRLCCGTIYYNLNNMWWVHSGKYGFENIANFQLFDFDPMLPRRELISAEKREKKIEAAKQSAIKREDYLRAARIRDFQKLK